MLRGANFPEQCRSEAYHARDQNRLVAIVETLRHGYDNLLANNPDNKRCRVHTPRRDADGEIFKVAVLVGFWVNNLIDLGFQFIDGYFSLVTHVLSSIPKR